MLFFVFILFCCLFLSGLSFLFVGFNYVWYSWVFVFILPVLLDFFIFFRPVAVSVRLAALVESGTFVSCDDLVLTRVGDGIFSSLLGAPEL
jgi:hypothetical protein